MRYEGVSTRWWVHGIKNCADKVHQWVQIDTANMPLHGLSWVILEFTQFLGVGF